MDQLGDVGHKVGLLGWELENFLGGICNNCYGRVWYRSNFIVKNESVH